MLTTPTARVLDERDEDAVHRLLATDPVAACVLAGRVEVAGTTPASLGAPLWGIGRDGDLDAVCLAGANLIPTLRGIFCAFLVLFQLEQART